MDCFLFNIDSGDLLCLGRPHDTAENRTLGLEEGHGCVTALLDRESFVSGENLRDFYIDYAHLVSFFLANSIGCRLLVLFERDLERLCNAALEQEKSAGRLVDAQQALVLGAPLSPEKYKKESELRDKIVRGEWLKRKRAQPSPEVDRLVVESLRKGLVLQTEGPYRGCAVYKWGNRAHQRVVEFP